MTLGAIIVSTGSDFYELGALVLDRDRRLCARPVRGSNATCRYLYCGGLRESVPMANHSAETSRHRRVALDWVEVNATKAGGSSHCGRES